MEPKIHDAIGCGGDGVIVGRIDLTVVDKPSRRSHGIPSTTDRHSNYYEGNGGIARGIPMHRGLVMQSISLAVCLPLEFAGQPSLG